MKKILLILSGILVIIVLAAAGLFWYMSTQPLYRPGMVQAGQNLRAPLAPPAQTSDPDYWQVEPDVRLYHFAKGTGRNVLIVHGGPGMPYREAMPGLEPLEGEYRFHYYDQRGCGQSTRIVDRFDSKNTYENMTRLDQVYGLGAQIADIERIRQLLGDEKLILVGHSWGGFLASLYAAEFPERVEKLILISPANTLIMPLPNKENDLYASVRARLPESELAAYDALIKDYFDFNQLFTRSESDLLAMDAKYSAYYLSVIGIPAEQMIQHGEPGGWMIWGMYASMGQRHNYQDGLRKVTAPVLVIHGAKDLQSEAATQLYSDTFPNARFEVIEEAGHFSFQEKPAEFSALIANFLQDQ